MKSLLDLTKKFLFSPSAAADACARPDAWKPALVLYAVFALLSLVSSAFDPLAFLDPTSPIRPPHTLGFWAAVGAWEPALMALSVWFTVLVLDWMREGWLPMKTAAATLWAVLPAAMALYYSSPNAPAGKGVFIVLLLLWLVPAVLLTRRVPAERWRTVGSFLLGLSVLQIVGIAVQFLVVVPSRSLTAFYAYSLVLLVWVTAAFAIGVRRLGLTGSAARAVLAFLFALIASSVVPSLAYLLGLMPKEVLKVVLYV